MKPLYGQGKGRVGVCMFNSVICCDVARQRRTRRSQLSHLSAGCCWLLQPRALLSSLRYPDREPSRLLAVIDKDGWLTPPGPPGHMMVTTGKVLLYSFRSVQGVQGQVDWLFVFPLQDCLGVAVQLDLHTFISGLAHPLPTRLPFKSPPLLADRGSSLQLDVVHCLMLELVSGVHHTGVWGESGRCNKPGDIFNRVYNEIF